VKRFSCFSQSQPVSAVYAKLLSAVNHRLHVDHMHKCN